MGSVNRRIMASRAPQVGFLCSRTKFPDSVPQQDGVYRGASGAYVLGSGTKRTKVLVLRGVALGSSFRYKNRVCHW
jgi:hypothetical protein